MISVVIPVHNEEKNVLPLYQELRAVLQDLGEEYEIIYVNDGSTDQTGKILLRLKEQDPCVRVLEMDHNRGEAAALTAGFWHARGEIVVSLDGDGQNDPSYIPQLLSKLQEGYKVVSGRRLKRKEPFLTRVLPSMLANHLIGLITGVRVKDNGCSLKAYRAEVVRRRQVPHGFHRFIPAVFGVKNEEVAEVPIIDRPRRFGRSHYGLTRTFEVLRELLTFPFLNRPRLGKPLLWGSFLWAGFRAGRLGRQKPLRAFFWFLLSGGSLLVVRNLSRFQKAQKEGVFRVREL